MALLGCGWGLGRGLVALAGVGFVLHLERKAQHLEEYVRKLEDEKEKLRDMLNEAVQGTEWIKERLYEAELQKSEYAVLHQEALKELLLKQFENLQLESQKKELGSDVEGLERRVQELKDHNENLIELCSAASQRGECMKEKLDVAEMQIKKQIVVKEELSKDIMQLQSQRSELAREVEGLERKVSGLEDDNTMLMELYSAASHGRECMKEKLLLAEKQVEYYEVLNKEASKNFNNLQSEKQELESALDHALEKMQRSEQKLVASNTQKIKLELSLHSVLKDVEEKEGEFDALMAQKMQLESSLCDALEKLREKERECENLTVQNKRELQEKDELQREIKRVSDQRNVTVLGRVSTRIGSALGSRTNPSSPGEIQKNSFGGVTTTTTLQTATKGIPSVTSLGDMKLETSDTINVKSSTKKWKGKKLSNNRNGQAAQRWRANKPDPSLIKRQKEAKELERLEILKRERREKISSRSNALAAVSPVNASSRPKNDPPEWMNKHNTNCVGSINLEARSKKGKPKKLTNITNGQTAQRWRSNKPGPKLIKRRKEEVISARRNALAATSPVKQSSPIPSPTSSAYSKSVGRDPSYETQITSHTTTDLSARSLSAHAEVTTELKNESEKIKRDLTTYTNTYIGLQMGDELGSGAFGIVHEADTRFNQKIAVKVPIADKLACLSEYEFCKIMYEFYGEAYMLSTLSHPNIVRFGYIISDVPRYGIPGMATEFMSGRDLFYFIHKAGGLRSWNNVWSIANQVASGLWYLHSEKIVHFDVKSSNILMDFNGRIVCKVADFGLALDNYSGEIPLSSQRGTLEYMAPEIIRTRHDGMQMVTEKVDVYSFGILLWELIVGVLPYNDMTDDEIEALVLNGYRPEVPNRCGIGWGSLMKACWRQDQSRRPSFDDILDILRSIHGAP